jgi:hypothetical protein
VGAGGIGVQLNASLNTLAWPQVSLIILVILGTVVVSEWVSAKVRHGDLRIQTRVTTAWIRCGRVRASISKARVASTLPLLSMDGSAPAVASATVKQLS